MGTVIAAFPGVQNLPMEVAPRVRICLLSLVLTLALVIGIDSLTHHERVDGPWPPEPEYRVVVTNNGPFFYVD